MNDINRNAGKRIPPSATSSGRPGGAVQRLAAYDRGQKIGNVDVRSVGPTTMEFMNLVVDPACRKQGWGMRLIGMALGAGTVQGKSMVQLESQDNGSGRLTRWYGAMGFSRIGTSARNLPVMAAPISALQTDGPGRLATLASPARG